MMLMQLYPAAAAILSQKLRLRRFKSRPRSRAYWTLMVPPKKKNLFFENLRMSKKFHFLIMSPSASTYSKAITLFNNSYAFGKAYSSLHL